LIKFIKKCFWCWRVCFWRSVERKVSREESRGREEDIWWRGGEIVGRVEGRNG